MNRAFTTLARRGTSLKSQTVSSGRRYMGGGGGEPHVPKGYDMLGKACLVSAFFWIMYRGKENKGQLFGLYLPWLDEHDHAHTHYSEEGDGGDTMPTLVEEEDH